MIVFNPGLMDILGEKFGFQVSIWLDLSQSHDTKDGVQSWAYGQDWQGLPLEGFGSFWTIGHPKFQYHIKSKMVSNSLGLWAGLALVALGEHWPPLPIPRAGKASSGQQRGERVSTILWFVQGTFCSTCQRGLAKI